MKDKKMIVILSIIIALYLIVPILFSMYLNEKDPIAISVVAIVNFFIATPIYSLIIGVVLGNGRKKILIVLFFVMFCGSICCFALKSTFLFMFIPIIFLGIGYIIRQILDKTKYPINDKGDFGAH